jgi:predicted Rossmann-fold nucleotide-binding protein
MTPPRKFRVVLFGSARVLKTDPVYAKYRQLGFEIGRRRIGGVTGGGPSLMEAFNEGIVAGWASIGEQQGFSHGVCIQQINRDEPPNSYLRQAYQHKHVLTRLHQFVRLGYWGAIILAEKGGYGSDLEKAIMHQLLQFGQLNVPLIGVGPMWAERKAWEKKWIIDQGLADARDADFLQCVPEAMDALPIVFEAHARYKAAKAVG